MAAAPNAMDEKATSLSSIIDDGKQQVVEGTDDKNRLSRHPRWTKLETLVLIEGKKTVENQGRRSRSRLLFGTGQPEPKWDFVSSYCRQHGVNRGSVQCRKRWSNLICDFNKIKGWESRVHEEGESFWMMRSDVRRDKKLPGFFDREVYSVLDGKAALISAYQMVLPTVCADGKENDGAEATETENEDGETEGVHEEGSHGKGKRDPISNFEGLEPEEVCRSAKVDIAIESPTKTIPTAVPISGKGKQTGLLWRRSIFQGGAKRRRLSSDGCQDVNLNHQLIKVMEKNAYVLNAQLDTQNMNSRLEREQQKDQSDRLVSALSKISDALARIADKL